MHTIQSVIFDVGGVLHENPPGISDDLAHELGLSAKDLSSLWSNEITSLGLGEIDEAGFWEIVARKYGTRFVDASENLLGRVFASKLSASSEVLAIVEDVRSLGVRTAILSNTIEPHAKAVRSAGLYDGFDSVFLSHEIGLRKPDPKVYEHALEVLGLEPRDAVFIDDRHENVTAALHIGMYGIVFTDPYNLRRDLRKLDLRI